MNECMLIISNTLSTTERQLQCCVDLGGGASVRVHYALCCFVSAVCVFLLSIYLNYLVFLSYDIVIFVIFYSLSLVGKVLFIAYILHVKKNCKRSSFHLREFANLMSLARGTILYRFRWF